MRPMPRGFSMAEIIAETERLILREWVEADRAPLAAIINTPAMLRYFGGPMSAAECDAFFERRLDDQRRHRFCYWALELKVEARLIGTCGLRLADDYAPDLPVYGLHEIGWRVGEQWWRQGLAIEAANAALGWAWTNTDCDLIAAWTSQPNQPSWRLMEKLGMSRRTDLDFEHPQVPRGSALRPHVTYSITRPQ